MLLVSISLFNHLVLNTVQIELTLPVAASVLSHRAWISTDEAFQYITFADYMYFKGFVSLCVCVYIYTHMYTLSLSSLLHPDQNLYST